MKLIWTYNRNVRFDNIVGEHTPEREVILLNYYIHSIKSANKLGYYTIIYCNSDLQIYFENLADEVIILNSYENSQLWDSFKIKVLEERNDDFVLIDGDVILHSKLPVFINDITFDSYEVGAAYKYKYKDIIEKMTTMGIGDEIDIWVNKQLPIISTGLLRINNTVLKNDFVRYWKVYNNFINKHSDVINIDLAVLVEQYLLSLVSENYTQQKLTSLVGNDNEYYKHHCGTLKYYNPIVPKDVITHNLKKMII